MEVEAPLVVALGRVSCEFLGAGTRVAGTDTRQLHEVSVQVGGGAAVAAAAAVAMGCRGRVCAKIADDFLGRFTLEGLRAAELDVSHIIVGEGVLSPFSFTSVSRRDGSSTSYLAAGDECELRPGDIPLDIALVGARALLLDGTCPAAQIEAAETARSRDIPVLLDLNRMGEGVGELIALADVLLCAERLASEVAPRGELQDSLIELQQLGPNSVVITMGETGSIGLFGDQLVRQAAWDVNVVDTSGAGSVFHGAFAASVIRGEPFARCMALAAVAAGLSCTELGGVAGIPDEEAVRAAVDAA